MDLLLTKATIALIAFAVVVYSALPTKNMNVCDRCRKPTIVVGVLLGALASSIGFDYFYPGTDIGYSHIGSWIEVLFMVAVVWQTIVFIGRNETSNSKKI